MANIITKSVKHYSGGKIADIHHYENSRQEKSPAERVIHVGP